MTDVAIEVENPDDIRSRELQAWARFGARILDVGIYMIALIVIQAIASIFYPPVLDENFLLVPGDGGFLHGVIQMAAESTLFLIMLLIFEPLLLSVFGVTPGKAMFGVVVRTPEGAKLSWFSAIQRTVLVFVVGQAYGLGVLALAAMLIQRFHLMSDGVAWWDQRLKLSVIHSRRPNWVWCIGFGIIILAFAANIWFSRMASPA